MRTAVIRESMWAIGFAGLALLLTWLCCGGDWPDGPVWTFYAPYSLYVIDPWPMAATLFVGMVALRITVRWRKRRVVRERTVAREVE